MIKVGWIRSTAITGLTSNTLHAVFRDDADIMKAGGSAPKQLFFSPRQGCYHFDMRANVSTATADLCNVPCFKERLVRRIQRELPDDETLTDAVSVFSALADRARLKIILALRSDEELCVCDVAHVLNVSISTASHHLRKLRDLRVVKYRSDGKMAYYSLRDEIAARLVTDALEKVEA